MSDLSNHPAVAAVNELTERWCARLGDGDSVVSAAGVWPLLALLASAAAEPARAELVAALGRPADTARGDALQLLDLLRAGASTAAALGIWAAPDAPLRPDWTAGLPDGVVGALTGREALDRWAATCTGGLIERFPLEVDDDTGLVLATALAARVTWRVPFDSWPRDRDAEEAAPDRQWSSRTTSDLSRAAVLDAVRGSRLLVQSLCGLGLVGRGPL